MSPEVRGSGEQSELRIALLRHVHGYTHCASRPFCVIVIMILSEKVVQVTSVCMPSMVPAACLVMAG